MTSARQLGGVAKSCMRNTEGMNPHNTRCGAHDNGFDDVPDEAQPSAAIDAIPDHPHEVPQISVSKGSCSKKTIGLEVSVHTANHKVYQKRRRNFMPIPYPIDGIGCLFQIVVNCMPPGRILIYGHPGLEPKSMTPSNQAEGIYRGMPNT